MTRPIDGIASIQQTMRLQDVLHSAQRQAQIPQEAQKADAGREKALAQERVERDEALLGQTIRDDDPREKRKRHRDGATEEEPPVEGQAAPEHIDLMA